MFFKTKFPDIQVTTHVLSCSSYFQEEKPSSLCDTSASKQYDKRKLCPKPDGNETTLPH